MTNNNTIDIDGGGTMESASEAQSNLDTLITTLQSLISINPYTDIEGDQDQVSTCIHELQLKLKSLPASVQCIRINAMIPDPAIYLDDEDRSNGIPTRVGLLENSLARLQGGGIINRGSLLNGTCRFSLIVPPNRLAGETVPLANDTYLDNLVDVVETLKIEYKDGFIILFIRPYGKDETEIEWGNPNIRPYIIPIVNILSFELLEYKLPTSPSIIEVYDPTNRGGYEKSGK